MLSTRACPVEVRVSRRRQPTSVTVESGTTRSDDVIAPTGPSPGATSSPCQSTSRLPSQTTTSCQTPLTSLTNRSSVNVSTAAPRRTPNSESRATSGSRRYARAAESRSWYGDQSGNTAGMSPPPNGGELIAPTLVPPPRRRPPPQRTTAVNIRSRTLPDGTSCGHSAGASDLALPVPEPGSPDAGSDPATSAARAARCSLYASAPFDGLRRRGGAVTPGANLRDETRNAVCAIIRWSGRTARPSACQSRTSDSQARGSVKPPRSRSASTSSESCGVVAT